MRILIIGSGGREHALAWKIAQSPRAHNVYVISGNGGTKLENEKISNFEFSKHYEYIAFAKMNKITFTIVGPEVPIAGGVVDDFRRNGLKIWGPTQYCAQLESSKIFAKNFMQKHNIPTAKYESFDNSKSAKEYLSKQSFPIVVKADGLAAGKGVLVAQNLDEAANFIDEIFVKQKFGEAGNKVLIEEFLDGTEASFIVMIDGKNILPMATSQDHKRLLDNDEGPNTGGMGAYSPAPIITAELHERIIKEIIKPVVDGMNAEGQPYTGFLYAGLMIDKQGNPKVLEFNCRLGDPEAQPILMRLDSDLYDLVKAGLEGSLDTVKAKWKDEYAVGVVMATKGYPENPHLNDVISGHDRLNDLKNVKVFHAGTKLDNGTLYTSGGRVFCVVARDKELATAQNLAYDAVNQIHFEGKQYRKDIANKAIDRK